MNDIPRDQEQERWDKLTEFAESVRQSESRASYVDEIIRLVNHTLDDLTTSADWNGVIRLRRMFEFLGAGETLGLGETLGHLNEQAIVAAEKLGDDITAGQFLHDKGQALHRQGKHPDAIRAFEQSREHYRKGGKEFQARESFYMTALCYRAIGNRQLAREIVEQVYQESGTDPWRANPLIVRSWLEQDTGNLNQAEATLRQAISILEKDRGLTNVVVGQSLADLGEIVGFLGRYDEANTIFDRALGIFSALSQPDPRQVARTLLKKGEVYLRQNDLDEAMNVFRQAFLAIAEAQYYDLMWRIQLAMAQVNLRQRDFQDFSRHMRLALTYRHAIGLSDWALVQQYLARRKMGTGLPR